MSHDSTMKENDGESKEIWTSHNHTPGAISSPNCLVKGVAREEDSLGNEREVHSDVFTGRAQLSPDYSAYLAVS